MPLLVAALGHALALAGRHEEARKVHDELVPLAQRCYVPAYHLAIVCAGLGETDPAFAWLEKAHGERDGFLTYLKVDPPAGPPAAGAAVRRFVAARRAAGVSGGGVRISRDHKPLGLAPRACGRTGRGTAVPRSSSRSWRPALADRKVAAFGRFFARSEWPFSAQLTQ